MTANISLKAIALAGISVLIAGSIAIVNTVSQGYLFEAKKATAELEKARAAEHTATAEMEKALAAQRAAEAAKLDAENKLKGTENAAMAVITGAQIEAAAAKIVGKLQADSFVRGQEIAMYPETAMVNSFTKPFVLEPAQKTAALNDQIVRLKREGESGIDRKTRRVLSESEIADRIAQQHILEEELATVQESASKNMSDTFGMLMNGMTQSMGNIGSLYPNGREVPVARRSLLEK